ncbi:hypothetical protein BCR36DRAFT_401655 [Piromyces finnis]|uniref:ARM repeat-containing protein n=1 Tax=Piromyces finnis TaxID=1754191 RepID=A0A1Y1VNC8_9FUNG|nr:hypothetical protein BCR36DRAFT_401655 [Piromyces finnis]|eukprot:ORX60131.1 hypothetical protein BCR36DRAFT_401655 [Piromyces finnis]
MKNIEISDITKAINKKESLSSNLFLLHSDNDGQNDTEDNQILIEPISTKVYSNRKEQKRNKIEVISESLKENNNNNNSNKRENKENQNKKAFVINESDSEISSNNIPISIHQSNNNNNSNTEKANISLGQSIILLLDANNKALVNSIDLYKKSTFIKSPLTSALQNIDKYIRNDNKGTAMKIIYNPLKDMIIKKKSNSNNSFKILNWLYFNTSTKKQLKNLLQEEISSGNKKSKLIAVQIYKNIIDEQSHSLRKSEEILCEDIEFWKELSEIYSSLVNIVKNDGVVDKDGKILPTLLTTLTYQLIISIFTSNTSIIVNKNKIKQKTQSSSGIAIEEVSSNSIQDYNFYPVLWNSVHCVSCALGCLISWDQKKYPLFETTLNEVLDFINTIIIKKDECPTKEFEIADVVSKLWININPYLSTKHIKNPIEKSRKIVEKILEEENEDFGHFGSLLKLSLLLGHQSKENYINIFKSDTLKENFLQIISSNILNNDFVGGRNLGFYMLRKFLLIDGPEKFKPMVDQLLIMLDQNDSVSKASIGFLAEYAAYCPEDVLPNIFMKLDSNKSVERMNSLFIIYEIFQLNRDVLKSNSHTQLRNILTEQLLLRINDEDIKLRNEAMLLFCYLDQNEIIPKLANKLIDSDEKVRAASETALLNTLLKHKSNIDVIFTYIEYIRNINQQNHEKKIPITPSQIHSIYMNKSEMKYSKEQQEKLIERQFYVIKKWAKELSTNSWIYIIEPLLKKVYASPEDQILVRFMSTISEYLVDESVVRIIFKNVTKLIIEQPKLNEELLNRNDEESVTIVKDILFLRISPLLILRVLPNKAYETLIMTKNYDSEQIDKNTDPNTRINRENKDEENDTVVEEISDEDIIYLLFKELVQRIEQIYEFDQVRKLSVEILASLPVQYIFSYLKYKFEKERRTKDLMQLKSYLYCICNVIIKHSLETLEAMKFIEFSFHMALEILIQFSKNLNVKDKAIQNIQMGCIECLSLIICSFVRIIPGEEESQKVLIKEINTSNIIEISGNTDLNNNNNNNGKVNESKFTIWNSEQVLYALLQLLNPHLLTNLKVSRDELGKRLPESFKTVILDILYQIQEQSQPLIFEILSISIANILTTTIRHYSKEIEANPTVSSPNSQSTPPTSVPSHLSEEDRLKNIQSLYKFANCYLLYPLLDTVQDGINYNSSKELKNSDLKSLQEQLYNTLTCACLQVLYHLVYYLRNGKFRERELEDILNVCLNGLSCNKSTIRESSLKLFSGLLSCHYHHDNTDINTSFNSLNKINLNIGSNESTINIPPLVALNSINESDSSSLSEPTALYSHGLFSEGKHALELIKAKRAIQQIAEMEEVTNSSTPTLSLARQLIVLMNSY